MSFSYFSFLINKSRKSLRRVDQRLLLQLSSSKLIFVLLVRHLQASLIPHGGCFVENSCSSWFPAWTSLPWLFTLTPHREVCVQFLLHCLEGLWKKTDSRMQTDEHILVTAVFFGLGPAFHTVQMSNTTEWCCFGSFVITGEEHSISKYSCAGKPFAKSQKVENSEQEFSQLLSPSVRDHLPQCCPPHPLQTPTSCCVTPVGEEREETTLEGGCEVQQVSAHLSSTAGGW